MDENREKLLSELAAKAERLSRQQQSLSLEIRQLRDEIRDALHAESVTTNEKVTGPIPVVEQPKIVITAPEAAPVQAMPAAPALPKTAKPKIKTPIEEFIGTNLLNKIGIAVLVLGLGIGAKYAIDHDMIDYLTRSILGFLSGLILIGLALRLKPKHAAFSAVLLSGGMAVLYFMTYVSYADYDLFPKELAFILMVIFTAFTVYASLQYDMKVIAVIGLVGAYAVPFLLSDGSGRVVILFSYMTIINAGILTLSFKKAWKVLYYIAFGLTWVIFMAWFFDQYRVDDHLWISLSFSTIFFSTFYASFLSYKLIQQEALNVWDIVLLTMNSFIYYGFGYAAISQHENGEVFLGIFTVFNAVLHFIACYLIYKRQDATRDIFYLVAGMVLVFLTLAVPVQLDGQWVTIIWALEGALLFWIGRTKKYPIYERLSYGLVVLTFISLVHDWQVFYPYVEYSTNVDQRPHITFLFNIQLFSSLLICVAWGAIIYLHRKFKPEGTTHVLTKIFEWAVPVLFLLVLYLSFHREIDTYWQQRYFETGVKQSTSDEYASTIYDYDLQRFGVLSLMIYSSIFTIILSIGNARWIKNHILSYAIIIMCALILLGFITTGLYSLAQLRSSYLDPTDSQYFFRDYWHILIRYISIAIIVPLLWIIYKNISPLNVSPNLIRVERVFFHLIVLVLLSSELVNVLDLSGINGSDRLALSILWAVYALGLIVYGLKRDEKFIRITAFVIFGITLIKLFFYDMAAMSTISKTIVMVILGAILLIASFIYNKFKAARNDS